MSHEYKVGDPVRVTHDRYGTLDHIGTVDEIDLDGKWTYLVKIGEIGYWHREKDLARAASSPDEQDIENAGGSDPLIPVEKWMRALDEASVYGVRQRDKTLGKAWELINGDRARDYGDAAENFQRIANLWAPILGKDVTAVEVSLCLLQLKVARIITTNGHEDSWIDAAGYVALGSEIANK